MKTLRYIGPHDGVRLPVPKRPDVEVARGDVVEIPDAYARTLLQQPANWEAVEAPTPPTPPAPADPTKED